MNQEEFESRKHELERQIHDIDNHKDSFWLGLVLILIGIFTIWFFFIGLIPIFIGIGIMGGNASKRNNEKQRLNIELQSLISEYYKNNKK